MKVKFNKVLNDIKTYEAGKPIELVVREYGIKEKDIIKLASNENPYGCSTYVTKKVKKIVNNMYIYPDDSMYELKKSLADRFNLDSKNIIIGAGSDQVIEFCVRAKCNENSKVLMSKTTFAMYEIYSKQVGATILKTPSHSHDLKEFKKIFKKQDYKIDIIFLCLPNNPLGECLDAKDVYDFIKYVNKKNRNTLIVLDGAYQEYASFKNRDKKIDPTIVNDFPNVVYLGTFSKAYGLGGMRVGYGISNEYIISTLHKLRPPFNITTLSLFASIEALKDEEFVKKSIKKNFLQMKRYEKWAKKRGIKFIDSYTNFITLYIQNSKDIALKLLKRGIIVRDLSSYGLDAIRITIGTKKQNDTVLKVLSEIIDG